MSKKVTRTIRCCIWDKERFEKMLSSVLRDFPGYMEVSSGLEFREIPESRGCDKLIIKAYKNYGIWFSPELEVVKKYYKPNK